MIIESTIGGDATILPSWLKDVHVVVKQHVLLCVEPDIVERWSGRVASGDTISDGKWKGTLSLIMTANSDCTALR
jgi:hypothetical protein